MQNPSKITCPKCGTEIDVQNVLTHQIEDDLKKTYELKYSEDKRMFDDQALELEKARIDFENVKKKEEALIQERVHKLVKDQEKQIEAKLVAKIESEKADEVELLQKELNEKSKKLKELNKSKAEISKLKREKDELRDLILAETQEAINKELSEEKIKIRQSEHEKSELAIKELEKKLADQKKLTEEMQRKQEQGSMQLQGEVQELAIEEWLANKFPLDTITEIKKGARGADCIQTIHTRTKQNCGTIYYESKRTKDFQPSWIEKFKNDIRDKGSDIAVLVTEAMPSDMERMGMKDGIWICTYEEFKGLCVVLRESIIQLSDALVSQENKGEKMTMLYDFLTSNEFRLQIEGIVEGFTQMKSDLETEKRSITGHWKKREKQIDKVVLNTNFMYNSIKGIAGNAIQDVKALEMPDIDIELEI